MAWLIPRLSVALVLLLLGLLSGYAVGSWWGKPLLGEAVGSTLAGLALVMLDAVRGGRLLQWLRGDQSGMAPRDAGMWGELGYRIERAVRLRDRRAEREREALEQFLSAIEASPNGVLMLDEREHIQWCNRVAADHFALDPVRDRLQRITNLVRFPAFVGYLHEGRFEAPLVLSNPRGQTTLSILVRPYGDGMRLVLSQDITERERNEAMRRDFVANVSHEIRTPLTVLAGFIETMSSLPLTEVERKRVLQLMTQQTQRMQTLVSDLLTLAQLEGSPRPAADSWVPLNRILTRVQTDVLALSAGRHTIHVSVESALSLAGAEPEIFSAVANLATNAVRYTPEGGQVDIHWRHAPDGSLEVCVADTGVGIAREHLPRLTERFYRVDGSRSRDTGGTGLGLSIVKHVMQRHGGQLDIQSEPGKGSRFRLVFPAARVRDDAVGGSGLLLEASGGTS